MSLEIVRDVSMIIAHHYDSFMTLFCLSSVNYVFCHSERCFIVTSYRNVNAECCPTVIWNHQFIALYFVPLEMVTFTMECQISFSCALPHIISTLPVWLMFAPIFRVLVGTLTSFSP